MHIHDCYEHLVVLKHFLEGTYFLTLVDVKKENLQFTRKRFLEYKNISDINNNGKY